jgi:hypothetical protein
MNLILRGARHSDFKAIELLLKEYDFELDFKHLECLVVIEDAGVVTAVGSLQTILEAAFVVDKSLDKYPRAKALQMLMTQANIETKNLQYPAYHCFATNNSIEKILLNREAKPVNGKALIKWVKKG